MSAIYELLHESSFHPWESVSAALEAMQKNCAHSEKIDGLVQHLLNTKQLYWTVISEALHKSPELPQSLHAMLSWELEQVKQLSETDLQTALSYSSLSFNVTSLLRLNARHSTWHAGQLALLVAEYSRNAASQQ